MNTHHTPGPWEIADILEDGSICMMVGGGKGDVHITHWPCPIPLDEREANARLIAAAPDLLEIVRQIAESKDYSELHMDEIGQQARAAIAKATQP